MVLIPIALGAYLNRTLPGVMKRFSPFAPLLAATMTVLVSASIVAQNAAAVRVAGPRLILGVFFLHLGKPAPVCVSVVCSVLPSSGKSTLRVLCHIVPLS